MYNFILGYLLTLFFANALYKRSIKFNHIRDYRLYKINTICQHTDLVDSKWKFKKLIIGNKKQV